MLYSKRRKNLGGGRNKRSTRKSNRQSLKGGSWWTKFLPENVSTTDPKEIERATKQFKVDCNWALTNPSADTGQALQYCAALPDATILGKKKVNELIAEIMDEINS
jgi:hypothetical protein